MQINYLVDCKPGNRRKSRIGFKTIMATTTLFATTNDSPWCSGFYAPINVIDPTQLVTMSSSVSSKVYPGKKPPKAKCAENQKLIDKLFEKRESTLRNARPGANSFYPKTLKIALDNIVKLKDAITSYEQAQTIKGVGASTANILFPNTVLSKSDKAAATAAWSDVESTASSKLSSRLQQQRTRTTQTDAATKKFTTYHKEVQLAQAWPRHTLQWRVVLLVDEREREKVQMESKCFMAKIPCEKRTLAIGDFVWVAQGFDKQKLNGRAGCQSTEATKPVLELVLGTIIERKTISDLASSIKGTRYVEQRMRLKHSGLPQLLLLVEGDVYKDARNERETKMCHTAQWETRLYEGFQIVQTANLTETIATLKRLHRRILQRTFPLAFYDEALPTFCSPDATGERAATPQNSSRRRRRRNESLMEMMFDIDPEPMKGMDRYMSYKELAAKIMMDRESATRTIAMIHAAMLKQVPKVENKKIEAIVKVYPTPHHLFTAYDERSSDSAKRDLVSSLPTSDGVRKLTVGLVSSKNVYTAYAVDQSEGDHQSCGDLPVEMHISHDAAQLALNIGDNDADSRVASLLALNPATAVMPTAAARAQSTVDSPDSSLDRKRKLRSRAVPKDIVCLLSSDSDTPRKPAARPTRPQTVPEMSQLSYNDVDKSPATCGTISSNANESDTDETSPVKKRFNSARQKSPATQSTISSQEFSKKAQPFFQNVAAQPSYSLSSDEDSDCSQTSLRKRKGAPGFGSIDIDGTSSRGFKSSSFSRVATNTTTAARRAEMLSSVNFDSSSSDDELLFSRPTFRSRGNGQPTELKHTRENLREDSEEADLQRTIDLSIASDVAKKRSAPDQEVIEID
jgi:ERCC4-type nuclease